MSNEIRKRYSNDEIVILWQASLCIHCGDCARGLPSVFKPKSRPWIQLEGAGRDEIEKQVALCPSGAISVIEP